MSDYRAIAGVSTSLRRLLRDRMEAETAVTIATPDFVPSGISTGWLNLYLYHVTESAALKNMEYRGQGSPGSYGFPPLSLDLHYMLTANGSSDNQDPDLSAQQMLGDAMRVLHDYPILTADLEVRRAAAGTVGDPILDTSLLNETERLRVVLKPSGIEETAKIWAALPKPGFRRSVSYQVSAVRIESRLMRRTPAAVTVRSIRMAPSGRPDISTVYRTPPPEGGPIGDGRVGIGQRITIEGLNFSAPKTWVRLGGLEPLLVTPFSDNLIELTIPDDQYPADSDHPAPRPIPEEQRLQPGPQTVAVLLQKASEAIEGGIEGHGTPGVRDVILTSNQSVFQLVPQIDAVDLATGTTAAVLTVTGRRLYRESLRSYLILGDWTIPIRRPGTGETFDEPAQNRVQVPLASLAALQPPAAHGTYRVRVMANGAQNLEEEFTFKLI